MIACSVVLQWVVCHGALPNILHVQSGLGCMRLTCGRAVRPCTEAKGKFCNCKIVRAYSSLVHLGRMVTQQKKRWSLFDVGSVSPSMRQLCRVNHKSTFLSKAAIDSPRYNAGRAKTSGCSSVFSLNLGFPSLTFAPPMTTCLIRQGRTPRALGEKKKFRQSRVSFTGKYRGNGLALLN